MKNILLVILTLIITSAAHSAEFCTKYDKDDGNHSSTENSFTSHIVFVPVNEEADKALSNLVKGEYFCVKYGAKVATFYYEHTYFIYEVFKK